MASTRRSAYFRLHPSLQHAIRHDLGWTSLRPVQEEGIGAILDGCNTVVLAPTAGGKTEASIFPVLSRVIDGNLKPVSVLYVCPIRALLNNQEGRLKQYARMVGLSAFKWHGDVPTSQRNRFAREPAHVVLTTPESLEVMLLTRRAQAADWFQNLSAVIVDEIHAFADDDRGAHLVAILERLARFCGHDVQRIGLSATVGNPAEIGSWLRGSSERPFRLVDPTRPPRERALRIELVEGEGELARSAARVARHGKSLVFCKSRSLTEAVAARLQASGVETFVHHGSVAKADRERAERLFNTGGNAAIASTSTLELGIDIGDLDHVIQVDAPRTVSSLLQRMGRTGRREGMVSNCTFLCTAPDAVIQAMAMIRLMEAGWVEDAVPERNAAHVLAHQVMALCLQEGGISRHRVLPWISEAAPFEDLDATDVTELIETMLEREILDEADGLLSLGMDGERRYGGRNFLALYSVFDTPPVLRVRHGRRDIGELDVGFLERLFEEQRGLSFRLAGRPWKVEDVDWSRGLCFVTPAPRGVVPTWLGEGGSLSYEVCQAMKRVLADDDEPDWLGHSANLELRALRAGYELVVPEGAAALELVDGRAQWHTFAGGAINRLLAEGLELSGGGEWRSGNLSLKTNDPQYAAGSPAAIRRLRDTDWHATAASVAQSAGRAPLSKFEPCLPERLERQLRVVRLVDVEGTRRFVAAHSVPIVG